MMAIRRTMMGARRRVRLRQAGLAASCNAVNPAAPSSVEMGFEGASS